MDKPVVHFLGDPAFFDYGGNPEWPVASLYALDHPILGTGPVVHTSVIVKKNEDGSFETLNTIYKPQKVIDGF